MKCRKLTRLLRKGMSVPELPESLARSILHGMWGKYGNDSDGAMLMQYLMVNDMMLTKVDMSITAMSSLPVKCMPGAFYLSLASKKHWQMGDNNSVTEYHGEHLVFGKRLKKAKLLLPPGSHDNLLLRISRQQLNALAKVHPDIAWLMEYEQVGMLNDQAVAAIPFNEAIVALYGKIINALREKLVNMVQLNRSLIRLLQLYASGLRSQIQYSSADQLSLSFREELHDFMDENRRASLTVREMARAVGMSESALKQKCIAEFGLPPKEYLLHRRLRQAADHLLYYPEIPVKDIAWEFGFENHSYFSREFGDCFKCTPSEYREKHVEGR